MHGHSRHDRTDDCGYTLLELIIVLALLAFLTAIVWPSLRRPLQRSTTQQAARQLAEDLGRARFNAIQSGHTMVFRYEPGGERYWIGPAYAAHDDEVSGDAWSEPEDASGSVTEDNDRPEAELVIAGMLENGAIFQDPAAADDSAVLLDSTLGTLLADERAQTEAVEPLVQQENAEVNWSAPVLIYPTGRAENASIVLLGPKRYSVTVTLRGLTGALSIGPLEHEVPSSDEFGAGSETERTGARNQGGFG